MRTSLAGLAVLVAGCGNTMMSPADGSAGSDGGAGNCTSAALRPTARKDIDAVLTGANKMIVYGGDQAPFSPMGAPSHQLIEDLWQLDLQCGTWTQLTVPTGAGQRGGYAAAWDAKRNRMIVVGGLFGAGAMPPLNNDTWALDLAALTWTKLAPSGPAPSGRVGHRLIYDPDADRVLLFGGTKSRLNGPAFGDLDELSFAGSADGAWKVLTAQGAAGAPSARYDVAMALDGKRKLMVGFGGAFDFMTYTDEVWAFDLATNAWRLIPSSGGIPSQRFGGKASYDAAGDKIWMFGGHDGGSLGLLNDTWTLSLNAAGTGATFATVLAGDADLTVAGADHKSPERRAKGALALALGKLFLFGGGGDCGPLDDTATLDLTSPGAWVPVQAAQIGETCFRRAMPNQQCTPGTTMECAAPF